MPKPLKLVWQAGASGLSSATGAAGPVAKPSMPRAWVPSRVELQGEHASGYSWRENDDELVVTFLLQHEATKAEVSCDVRPTRVQLAFWASSLLHGPLVGRVDPDGCAWSFEAADLPQLTLTLAKREPGLWGYVLLEDLEANQEEPPERDGPLDGSDEPTASSLQRPGVDWG